jgi:hypothetical protein
MTRTDHLIAVVAMEGGKYKPVPRLRVKARSYPQRILSSGACDSEILLKSRLDGRYGPPMLRFPAAYRYDVVWRRWIKRYVSRTMRPSALAAQAWNEAQPRDPNTRPRRS